MKYAKTHEYLAPLGEEALVGITAHAADQLGDVVYVELPKVGATLTRGGAFGVVESVKAVSDLYSPVGGTVVAVNERLADEPGLVNASPLKEGWMLRVRPSDPAELEHPELLDEAAYADHVAAEAH